MTSWFLSLKPTSACLGEIKSNQYAQILLWFKKISGLRFLLRVKSWVCAFSGLLGGHSMALMLKERGEHMQWYQDELLNMAKDLGLRLLPAFNTSSGLPYPRVRHNTHRTPEFSTMVPDLAYSWCYRYPSVIILGNASQIFFFFFNCWNAMLALATAMMLFRTD